MIHLLIYFLRPPIGRSVKYTQKQKVSGKTPSFCITNHLNIPVFVSGEQYYPHTVTG